MRRFLVTVAVLPGLIIAGTAATLMTVPAAALAHPVIVVVSRPGAVGLMQHGWWCTRLRPGQFECTPAAPR